MPVMPEAMSLRKATTLSPVMQRYVILYLTLVCTLLLLAGAVNILVDPFGIFDLNQRGIYTASEREQRQGAAPKRSFDAVVLANSKLSMQDPGRLEGFDWFNLSASGARVEELTGLLDVYVHDQELAVLGIDFWMFDEAGTPVLGSFRPQSARRILERYVFNGTTLWRSFETLHGWWTNEPPLSLPGGFSNKELAARIEREAPQRNFQPSFEQFRQTFARGFVLSEARLAALRTIRDTMESRGVELVVFLHPQNRLMRDLMDAPEFREAAARFEQEIRAIFPDLIDLTDSVYSEDQAFFLTDPIHYTPQVSTDFLNREVIPRSRRYQERLESDLDRKR